MQQEDGDPDQREGGGVDRVGEPGACEADDQAAEIDAADAASAAVVSNLPGGSVYWTVLEDAARGDVRLADGSVLIADAGNSRVRRVAAGGTIDTIAGTGVGGFSGDGGPAPLARFGVAPRGPALAAWGELPKDLKLPEGVGVDEKSGLWSALQVSSKEIGLTKDQYTSVAGRFA